jgi:hypothetical protein
MYSFKEVQEIKEYWKLKVMYHQLIIVALISIISLLIVI